ncbi:MAG: hypothetical protein WCJ45_07900 [bacterium]
MPDIFENFFLSIGKRLEDYLKLIKLTPNYRVYFAGGHQDPSKLLPPYLDVFSDIKKTQQQFELFEP